MSRPRFWLSAPLATAVLALSASPLLAAPPFPGGLVYTTPNAMIAVDTAGASARTLARNSVGPQDAAWSRDGQWIAYIVPPSSVTSAIAPGLNTLWVVGIDGSGRTYIPPRARRRETPPGRQTAGSSPSTPGTRRVCGPSGPTARISFGSPPAAGRVTRRTVRGSPSRATSAISSTSSLCASTAVMSRGSPAAARSPRSARSGFPAAVATSWSASVGCPPAAARTSRW